MSSPTDDPYAHLSSAERARELAAGPGDASLSVGQKVDLVARYLAAYPRRVLVETGLWEGWGTLLRLVLSWPGMQEDAANFRLVLIDVQPENVWTAEGRLPSADVRLGNSAKVLPSVLDELDEPAFFWLDAHDPAYPVPLWEELTAIVAHPLAREHVVLVDDVRMMVEPWEGFPTLERVLWLVEPYWSSEIADDVLRLTPR